LQSIRTRSIAASVMLGVLATLAACRDGTAPVKPASIEIVSGNGQSGVVGQRLGTAPTFVVKDENGREVSGVGVAIAVTAGNGTVAGAPRKSAGGPTSISGWTLGLKPGLNQLTVSVAGLAPIVFNATAAAGPAVKIVAAVPTTIAAHVGDIVTPAPVVTVEDAYGNPVAGSTVRVTITGGGTATQVLTADASGKVTVVDWTLGTKVGQDVLTIADGSATLSFIANKLPGDPAKIAALSGDMQSGLAGAPLAASVLVRVTDRFDNTIPGQHATFTVTSGGGVLAATTSAADADGVITVPSWTLGRTALPQVVHVTDGSVAGDVSATVQTDFHIDVRFFGPEMTAAQKALFTNAAARLTAIVIGDIPDFSFTNFDVASACGVPGLAPLNETVDDLVIYASIQDIDGEGKILAQAGPCAFRGAGDGFLTTVGVMEFDAADVDRIEANGTLQDVITHEMLHVLGIGTLWSAHGLTRDERTPSVTYLGVAGIQGCLSSGGAAVCTGGVPVENNGVIGTADAHWRESVFQSELMTGYVNAGGMPLSVITIGSLRDLGYTVNLLAADPYLVPVGGASPSIIPGDSGWERPIRPPAVASPTGAVAPLKRP
jgi:hypothetical protein